LHNIFKEGRENVEDESRSKSPFSLKNDQNVEVRQFVLAKDRRLTVNMIAEECCLNNNVIHRILTDVLQMRII